MRDRRSRASLRVAIVAIATAAVTLLFPATVQPTLVADAGAPAQQAVPRVNRAVPRSRVIRIDFGALPASGRPGALPTTATRFAIPLFDGASIVAVFDHFDPNADGVTWVGRVDGVAQSNVTLVYDGRTLAGTIAMAGRSFSIRPVPAGAGATQHVLAEIAQQGLPREAPPVPVVLSPASIAEAAPIEMTDSGNVIDVLVVYTPAAAAAAASGISNLVNLAISNTNTAYANSGVTQRLRLVGAQQVPYAESSTFSTNLTNLRDGLQGLGGVASMRDGLGADLVAMLVHPAAPDNCGIGFLMTGVSTAFAPFGFSVTDTSCVSISTFAHELGHNMGLRHDWYVDNGTTPFTYAHGHVNTVARFRTIMAYDDQCTAVGFTCPRILGFSNPTILVQGQPTGIAAGTRSDCPINNLNNTGCDADERLALNNTALSIANFRQALGPPVIVIQPQSRSLSPGQAAELSVSAGGFEPLSYQWYRGTSPSTANPISGATSSSLNVTLGQGGVWVERTSYWVRVSNAAGSADSVTVDVTIAPARGPAILIPTGRSRLQR